MPSPVSTILHKRSSVPSKVPELSSLSQGELAMNVFDGKMFIKTIGNTIKTFSGDQYLSYLISSIRISNTAVDVLPRDSNFSEIDLVSNTIHLSMFVPATNITVSKITMSTGSHAGSTPSLAKMGLYEWNEEAHTATLVASTSSSSSLFTQADTLYTLPFSTEGNLPANYELLAGNSYAAAVIVHATNMPHLLCVNSTGPVNKLPPVNAGQVLSQTTLASTLTNLSNAESKFYARLS